MRQYRNNVSSSVDRALQSIARAPFCKILLVTQQRYGSGEVHRLSIRQGLLKKWSMLWALKRSTGSSRLIALEYRQCINSISRSPAASINLLKWAHYLLVCRAVQYLFATSLAKNFLAILLPCYTECDTFKLLWSSLRVRFSETWW